jgi:transaldolase
MTITAADLKVKIFSDGADIASMLELAKHPLVKGFTTNPSLMRKAGVVNYTTFAAEVVAAISDRHISFEAFSDELPEMERQARTISSWGEHVYAKLPVTNSKGEPLYEIVHRLSREGIKVNLTAVFTNDQVTKAIAALDGGAPAIISVFAGRIADTGVDPMPAMRDYVARMRQTKNIECIWASTREPFNIAQADEIGCHIITAPADMIKKTAVFGRSLEAQSLDTIETFRKDSIASGFTF